MSGTINDELYPGNDLYPGDDVFPGEELSSQDGNAGNDNSAENNNSPVVIPVQGGSHSGWDGPVDFPARTDPALIRNNVEINTNDCPLLIINGHNYTSCIKAPSWKVNLLPVYEEWTSADRITHREILRTTAKGTFTITFSEKSEYFQFLRDVKENTTPGGYIVLSVYVNNYSNVITGNFFLEMEMKNQLPFIGTSSFEGIEVTIQER